MHPPFSTVDHRIDSISLPWEERRVLRRSAPEPLQLGVSRFDLSCPLALPRLEVGEPRPTWRPSRLRVRLGEALMALGQRLAASDAAL